MKLLFAVRNVAGHAAEMGARAPERPVFFLKPGTALQAGPDLSLPRDLGRIDHELELAVEVGARLTRASPQQADAAIRAVGVVLDLTARELQSELKRESLPWLAAKGFDGSCVLGPLTARTDLPGDLAGLELRLDVNGDQRQRFRVGEYRVPPAELLSAASHTVTLEPGDVVGCGTGAGVGPLWERDELVATMLGVDAAALKARVATGPQRS